LKLEQFYGAGDDSSKFATYIIRNCIKNTPLLNLTKGEQRRDFIHVDDVVSAFTLLMQRKESYDAFFSEFYIGSGKSIPIRQFVETVHQITNSKTVLAFGEIPYREGELMSSNNDISRLKSLGWSCRYDLTLGLKKVIEEERFLIESKP